MFLQNRVHKYWDFDPLSHKIRSILLFSTYSYLAKGKTLLILTFIPLFASKKEKKQRDYKRLGIFRIKVGYFISRGKGIQIVGSYLAKS